MPRWARDSKGRWVQTLEPSGRVGLQTEPQAVQIEQPETVQIKVAHQSKTVQIESKYRSKSAKMFLTPQGSTRPPPMLPRSSHKGADTPIDRFVLTYHIDYESFFQLARLASKECDTALKRSGIHAITTFRAKQPERLREKLLQRDELRSSRYASDEDIYNDIPDLAGVRIALYFPDDIDKVKKVIHTVFNVERVKEHNRGINNQNKEQQTAGGFRGRFVGYVADHYLVRLPSRILEQAPIIARHRRIEIQVASLLMHAWSEVNHDLGYKPIQGTPSVDEHRILDSINGLVLTGELLLQQLHAAVNSRIQSRNRNFMSQYDLGAFMQDLVSADGSAPLMGRMDILFGVLTAMDINSPHKLHQNLGGWDKRIADDSSVAVSVMDHIFSKRNYMDDANQEPAQKREVLLRAKMAYNGLREDWPEGGLDSNDHLPIFDSIQRANDVTINTISSALDAMWSFFKQHPDINTRVAFGIAALGETRIIDQLNVTREFDPESKYSTSVIDEQDTPSATLLSANIPASEQ